MSGQWVVLLNDGSDGTVYGPMDAVEAEAFAAFMTKTVDPAEPRKLHSPTAEMLAWWRNEMDRNNCTHGDACPVHPSVKETST